MKDRTHELVCWAMGHEEKKAFFSDLPQKVHQRTRGKQAASRIGRTNTELQGAHLQGHYVKHEAARDGRRRIWARTQERVRASVPSMREWLWQAKKHCRGAPNK